MWLFKQGVVHWSAEHGSGDYGRDYMAALRPSQKRPGKYVFAELSSAPETIK
jgi:hypothetical protein